MDLLLFSAPNHLIGGLLFTGIFGSLFGISILTNWWFVGITFFSSILPDIDHPKSPIGRLFKPVSKWLNRKYGHRTLTHGIPLWLLLVLVFGMIETAIHDSNGYTIIFALAYFSHIFLDMMTVQGVKLFYPFMKNDAVLPGDKKFRLSTNSVKAEAGFFMCCLVLVLAFSNMFKVGFWTSYNSLFGTTKHIASEWRKADDLLLLNFEAKKGSEEIRGSGFVIDATENRIVYLDDAERFQKLSDVGIIENLVPIHTGRKIWFRDSSFVGISADSLSRLIAYKPIIKLKFESSEKLFLNGESKNSFSGSYLNGNDLVIREPKNSNITRAPQKRTSPRAETIRQKIKRQEKKNLRIETDNRNLDNKILETESEIGETVDLIDKQFLIQELQDLKRQKKKEIDLGIVIELKRQLSEVYESDRQKFDEDFEKYESDLVANSVKPARISGVIEFVEIEEKK